MLPVFLFFHLMCVLCVLVCVHIVTCLAYYAFDMCASVCVGACMFQMYGLCVCVLCDVAVCKCLKVSILFLF